MVAYRTPRQHELGEEMKVFPLVRSAVEAISQILPDISAAYQGEAARRYDKGRGNKPAQLERRGVVRRADWLRDAGLDHPSEVCN